MGAAEAIFYQRAPKRSRIWRGNLFGIAESGENAQLNRDHVAQMRGEKLVKVIVT